MAKKAYDEPLNVIKSWLLDEGDEFRHKVQVIKKGRYHNVSITRFWLPPKEKKFVPTKRNVFLRLAAWQKLESIIPEVNKTIEGNLN